MLTKTSKWNKDTIDMFFAWLQDCILSFNVITLKDLERDYNIYVKEDDQIDIKTLISLTLYIFQQVLKKIENIDLEKTELYGVVCFGISLKYLSETINGNILSFLFEIIDNASISVKHLRLAEIEVLNMINYTLPMNESEIELSENYKKVLETVIFELDFE